MKTLIKNSIVPLVKYVRSKPEREFVRLYDRYAKIKRYKETQVKFEKYNLRVVDALSFVWQYKEMYVDRIYKFHSMKKNPIILDCGANIGVSCIYFKELFPGAEIFAYEADIKIAEILEDNLIRNNLHKNVTIVKKAIWTNDKGVIFAEDGADGGSVYGQGKKKKIGSIRLKDEILKHKEIDMLKVDIEGAEVEVFKDCKNCLKNVKNMFVEYHSLTQSEQKLDELLNVFRDSGFRYYIVNPSVKISPFVNKNDEEAMDLQLNIFCYR